MERIEGVDRLVEVLGREGRSLLYKHSPRCWICRRAIGQVREFVEETAGAPVFLIDVLRDGDVSDRAAERLEVSHRSPQVILVEDGEATWSTSHLAISADGLRDRVFG